MGINFLDKRIIILVIILLFATTIVQAEDIVLPVGELSKDDLILQQAQEQVLATSNVTSTIGEIAAQEKANLELALTILLQNQNESQTAIIITIIIVTLASQGIWWALYLFFQSKGVLPAIKPKNPPKQKTPPKPINLQEVFE